MAERSDAEPHDLEPAGLEPAGLELAGLEPAGLEPAGLELAGLEPAGLEPAGLELAGLEPADLKPADLKPADPAAVARAVALRLLTGAPRSRAELAAAMARKEVPDDVAQAVLDRFTEVGLIDDAEYARTLVRSRHAGRGLARRALGVELRRKGIDDELAAQALETIGADQEEATARALARRRLASSGGLAREVRLRRVVAMLGRKGYSSGLAVRVVLEVMDDELTAASPDRPAGSAQAVDADDEWLLADS